MDIKENYAQEDKQTIKISKSRLFKAGLLLISIIFILMLFKSYDTETLTNVNALASNNVNVESTGNSASSGEVQIVKMRVENGRYIIEPSTFKVGIPIRIEADISKMPGCSKSVVIPAFNIRKNLNENDNVIEFTPNKAGTFNIVCSMSMYRGTFSVLQSDGTKANYVEKASTSGGTCGANGGGCGCGG